MGVTRLHRSEVACRFQSKALTAVMRPFGDLVRPGKLYFPYTQLLSVCSQAVGLAVGALLGLRFSRRSGGGGGGGGNADRKGRDNDQLPLLGIVLLACYAEPLQRTLERCCAATYRTIDAGWRSLRAQRQQTQPQAAPAHPQLGQQPPAETHLPVNPSPLPTLSSSGAASPTSGREQCR